MKKLNSVLTKEYLKQKYEKEKLTSSEIGKLVNCSRFLVLYYIKKNKIKTRTTGESLIGKLVKDKNPNYRHGKYCNPNYCLDCGNLIDKCGRSIRCQKCNAIYNPSFLGKRHTKKTLKIIGEKSKAKFTPEFIKRVYQDKHQGLKKRAINGYTLIKNYNHPDRNKHNDILEHRLIMEQKIGRRLKKKEIVHHIDQNRTNNKRRNLFLCSGLSEHGTVHASFRKLLPILLKRKIVIFKNGKYIFNGDK
jgi:hypothetical protein